ncbi:MAG: AMP-binding protein [Thermodesulfobacteriota bacterium]
MNSRSSPEKRKSADQESVLLRIIQQLMEELHPQMQSARPIQLDSSLDRDLGLDSLARVELLGRIEQQFEIALSEHILATAESPRDLLRCIKTSHKIAVLPSPETTITPSGDNGPAELAPLSATTLLEVLNSHVHSDPERIHLVYEQHGQPEQTLTYEELSRGAERIAAGLQHHNIEPGDTVAIMLPTGLDYFFCFFGILLAGGIPVPLYPPARPTQIEEHLRRHRGILNNGRAKILITMAEVKQIGRLLKARVESLETVDTPEAFVNGGNKFTPIPVSSNDVAFIQYTSGSTGDPKGVVLTHANLLANIRAMGGVAKVSGADVFVSWLPLYHDMGLIGAWFGSLYYGCRLVIMQPLSFLARPERWLWAIHKHRGTLSASPNFGYEFCIRRLDDKRLEGLDLSSWRMAFNGAEPVSAETITCFSERFEPYGFNPRAAAPVYGLAESSVGLAFPPPDRGPIIETVSRETLNISGRAVPVEAGESGSLKFVSCGNPLPGHQIRIVDESGRELPDRYQGLLQFKGPSATSGYFRNPQKSRELFCGQWLDSGDLAYAANGELFITSRIKDIIIRGGRNIYPHELEELVGNIPDIRKGCVAVFGSLEEKSGTERLVILAESRKQGEQARDELRSQVVNHSVDLLGMPPDEVVIAPPGTVLKTSSGKIRRGACRELYEQGGVGKPRRALWLQLTRIALGGVVPQIRRQLRRFGESLYAAYCWLIYGLIGVPLWLLVVVVPSLNLRWRVVRRGLGLLFFFTGVKITRYGFENVTPDQPLILVSNHASYLDSLVLAATLPISCSFVAKAELEDNFFVRVMLNRLDVIFVERFDMEKGVADSHRIEEHVAAGRRPLFFAEGTLQRMVGLLPFQLGAFVTGARTEVPVLPITIRGTRNILRSGSWFPRRGRISVTVSEPIPAKSSDWDGAITLRDAVRDQILRSCGEPDLGNVYTSLSQMELKRPENHEQSNSGHPHD